MASFTWEGKTKAGEYRSGQMDAKNAEEVNQKLKAQGVTPTKVKGKGIVIRMPKLPGFGGVGTKDLVIFTRQFSTMIDAGLPLVQCLEILSTQSDNTAMKEVLRGVKENVEGGATFADSLRKYPKVFDNLFVNLVQAGEVGGILDTIMNRLAVYIEKNMKLIKKIKGAMIYPICIVVVAIIVMIVMLYYIIPVFEKMFHDFGARAVLPGPTQNLIDLSKWVRTNWYIVFGTLAFIIFGTRYFKKTKKGRYLWDKMMLKVPMIGSLLRKVAVAKFTRTMGTMVSSGVPILDALDIVAKSAGNKVIEEGIYYTREKISEGKTMAEPLAEAGVFPGMVVQMIAVGENTGALDQMLNKIADFYDEEVDVAVEALTSLMEPFMMVLLGGMVGYFMVAMYLPIFGLANAIEG
ncbi:MAG TPA: type II secretion system F family protein [Myxococcota bacterium]|nr:type II secretion system F family protein [Myxococcota bacterium]HRY95108.1 type II secretion system F family protein [Myxococcota bacterium]HSA21148.1 type II secretion system F family protein [Myxococcota bacterium]